MKKALILLSFGLSFAGAAGAQTAAEIEKARVFFATHDDNGDGQLSKPEFTDGFISQAIAEKPIQARAAIALYGRGRIENCLGLGFDRADANGNALMSLEELGEAYRRDAFDDLRDIC